MGAGSVRDHPGGGGGLARGEAIYLSRSRTGERETAGGAGGARSNFPPFPFIRPWEKNQSRSTEVLSARPVRSDPVALWPPLVSQTLISDSLPASAPTPHCKQTRTAASAALAREPCATSAPPAGVPSLGSSVAGSRAAPLALICGASVGLRPAGRPAPDTPSLLPRSVHSLKDRKHPAPLAGAASRGVPTTKDPRARGAYPGR